MGFRYLEGDNGAYENGLYMWQPPNISSEDEITRRGAAYKITDEKARKTAIQALIDNNELTTPRLFLGKRRDDSNELLMSDRKGIPRISLKVAPDGTPKLQFFDEAGKIIYSLPDDGKVVRK